MWVAENLFISPVDSRTGKSYSNLKQENCGAWEMMMKDI